MKTLKTIIILAPVLVVHAPLYAQAPQGVAESMLTVKVVGEDSQPVEGARVGVGFHSIDNITGKSGLTDRAGDFTATGRSASITYGATKDGYYESRGAYDFTGEPQNGRWQPWNPMFTVVLKKMINPVPMYAKRVQVEIPAENKPIGFDLQEADWVAPHGKGRAADFVFHLTRRFASRKDYETRLRLTFSNEGDGIQSVLAPKRYGSELRLPHNAPARGYEPLWERTDSSSNPAEVRDDQNYFFRIRSQAQKALYGKIHGEIEFGAIGSKTAFIVFTYYLNPDGTRNVEFDPKQNLFKNLKPLEEVNAP